jgi:hypothetical protein
MLCGGPWLEVVDESEGAVERDQAIVRDNGEQMSAFHKGNQKTQLKNTEHMLIVEKVGRCKLNPMKPMLKATGTRRLKLECDEPLSNFAFNFNLRRYKKAIREEVAQRAAAEAGACTRPLFGSY